MPSKASKRNQKKSNPKLNSNSNNSINIIESSDNLIEGERTVTGNLTSYPLSRDVKVESFSISSYGRELICDTTLELNMGRRIGLIGANGSGKSTFLKAIAAREVPIPGHIDIFLLNEEAPPSELTASEAVIAEVLKEQRVIISFFKKIFILFFKNTCIIRRTNKRKNKRDWKRWQKRWQETQKLKMPKV